jgi:putative ABC transport system ATP-binding protein/macrolide transport system ATP-binding/permease protein/lipoprotein-releasing system ATP-binding protein
MHSSRRKDGDVTLSAQLLTKRYGAAPGYAAVRGASLELRDGEFVSIVGRSGSGKSTLMAMLGALTRPTEGKLLLNGTDVWTLPETERATFRSRHVGFVFQFPSLLSNLTAVDNVAVPALLGRTMEAEEAYARAHDLLARVGLADRAEAYPGSMSGGEQRRVAVARALINAPPLLLADEPTSDLDEDTETDIIDLLEQLQRTEAFSLVLVTHDLGLAKRAQRSYEMRQGTLAATDLPQAVVEPQRRFTPAGIRPERAAPAAARAPIRLGANLWRGVKAFLIAAAVIFAAILAADIGVEKYQAMRVRERAARIAALQHLALNRLRGDVQSVTDLGDGRYELTTYLQNVGGEEPIYVMAPDMRAYVQVRTVWQEVPMTPADDSATGVAKIEGKQTYRYRFDARVRDFAQLLPNYMHVRFSGTMLVSPSNTPNGDVFERKDNYYVYLKPFDVADEVVLRRMRFSGKPPVWIPMPPH